MTPARIRSFFHMGGFPPSTAGHAGHESGASWNRTSDLRVISSAL
jgi:hypothetical protein